MQSAERGAVLEQHLIRDTAERSPQRRKHRQLIVRPFDRGERSAHGLDFLARVKRLASDQQVRNGPRFKGVHVGPCHVLTPAVETTKQNRDVAGLERGTDFHGHQAGRCPFGDRPAAFVDQPVDKRPDRRG